MFCVFNLLYIHSYDIINKLTALRRRQDVAYIYHSLSSVATWKSSTSLGLGLRHKNKIEIRYTPKLLLCLLQAILKAKHCVLSADTEGVLQSLNTIADNIELLKSILTRMYGKHSLQ